MDYFNAFWTGGLICALVQILLDKTKLLPGRVMVLLVVSGAVLSAVGIYQPFAAYAGAGASVPLLGFGQVLWKGIKKAIDQQGFLGAFYRRLYCLRRRSVRRPYFFLDCQPYLPSSNEGMISERSIFHERHPLSPD